MASCPFNGVGAWPILSACYVGGGRGPCRKPHSLAPRPQYCFKREREARPPRSHGVDEVSEGAAGHSIRYVQAGPPLCPMPHDSARIAITSAVVHLAQSEERQV